MSRILASDNFINQLNEIKAMDWDVSVSRGAPVLQQTKKNSCKRELLVGLRNYLSQQLDNIANVYYVSEGIAIELENDAVSQKCKEGNGFITLVLDLKFKDLSYDAMSEEELFGEENKRKEELKAEKEALKAEKASKAQARIK